MTKNYCTFIPSKGKDLFKKLNKEFGLGITVSAKNLHKRA